MHFGSQSESRGNGLRLAPLPGGPRSASAGDLHGSHIIEADPKARRQMMESCYSFTDTIEHRELFRKKVQSGMPAPTVHKMAPTLEAQFTDWIAAERKRADERAERKWKRKFDEWKREAVSQNLIPKSKLKQRSMEQSEEGRIVEEPPAKEEVPQQAVHSPKAAAREREALSDEVARLKDELERTRHERDDLVESKTKLEHHLQCEKKERLGVFMKLAEAEEAAEASAQRAQRREEKLHQVLLEKKSMAIRLQEFSNVLKQINDMQAVAQTTTPDGKKWKKKEELAAVRIQKVARGREARKQSKVTKDMLSGHEEVSKDSLEMAADRLENAAKTIQRFGRGKMGRTRTQKKREAVRSVQREASHEIEAATKIQSAMRAMEARRQVQEMKYSKPLEEEDEEEANIVLKRALQRSETQKELRSSLQQAPQQDTVPQPQATELASDRQEEEVQHAPDMQSAAFLESLLEDSPPDEDGEVADAKARARHALDMLLGFDDEPAHGSQDEDEDVPDMQSAAIIESLLEDAPADEDNEVADAKARARHALDVLLGYDDDGEEDEEEEAEAKSKARHALDILLAYDEDDAAEQKDDEEEAAKIGARQALDVLLMDEPDEEESLAQDSTEVANVGTRQAPGGLMYEEDGATEVTDETNSVLAAKASARHALDILLDESGEYSEEDLLQELQEDAAREDILGTSVQRVAPGRPLSGGESDDASSVTNITAHVSNSEAGAVIVLTAREAVVPASPQSCSQVALNLVSQVVGGAMADDNVSDLGRD